MRLAVLPDALDAEHLGKEAGKPSCVRTGDPREDEPFDPHRASLTPTCPKGRAAPWIQLDDEGTQNLRAFVTRQ